LPEQKLDTKLDALVNESTNMAGYQKAIELIQLVTHCNNMNAHNINLA